MNPISTLSIAVILSWTISCKTLRQSDDSSIKDVGVISTLEARTLVLYEDQGKVYLKLCKPPQAPPLTRNCPSDATIKSLDLSVYLYKLPYDVGPYQRDQASLVLVTKSLQDARSAVNAGNQMAVPTVERLAPIKINLEKLLAIRDHLTAQQQDLTYYEYNDEFSKLLFPFEDSSSSAGNAIPGMRFIPVQGRIFEMQETEVTRGQWAAVVGQYPENLPRETNRGSVNYVAPVDQNCFARITVFDDNHPVSCVSWYQANDFARRMTDKRDGYVYRLPSESEWADAAGTIDGATYGHCNASTTQTVGALRAHNGLYDMVGNVWELTSSEQYVVDRGDRIIRGHGWDANAQGCRSGARYVQHSWRRSEGTGFRLLRTPSP